MQRHEGWLLDLYPEGGQMVLWFITKERQRLRLLEPFSPSFFIDREVDGKLVDLFQLRKALRTLPGLEDVGPASRLDFWSDQPREVEEIRVTNLDRYHRNVQKLERLLPYLTYYNCDILPEIHYNCERSLFPTARCAIEADGERLISCKALDDPLGTDYKLPPLRVGKLKGICTLGRAHPRIRSLTYTFEGRSICWEDGVELDLLQSFSKCVRETDPDLIWSTGGDSVLFPALFAIAARYEMTLALDRESNVARRLVMDGRSYISYGRVLYQSPDYPLFGRWHLDEQNCFWTSEAGLEGLVEVTRLSRIPLQRAARRSIGTGISNIQLDLAYREGYLIPWKKAQPEAWKTAVTLLKSDRGGLTYQPITGVYDDVVELDFVSMYPSIMVRENVSPETVNCPCCEPNHAVPELDYTICQRRKGLVSRAIAPLIEKRKEYKRLRKLAKERKDDDVYRRADGRQGAIKWLLVCCFGYLGYRNARFGRIEAHESTCAFSREKLLVAREICEAHGFRMLHAIVDCVWIKKEDGGAADIEKLCAEINAATDLTIAVEGHYSWIAFLPSRPDPETPVPARYFGRFTDGQLKYRGIELRRHDQAPYAQRLQSELLTILQAAATLEECRAMKEKLVAVVRTAIDLLMSREVPIEELIMRRKTSMEADEYRSNNVVAVVARQAVRAGFSLHAGEAVHYLVLNAKDRDPDSRARIVQLLRPEDTYDASFYVEQVRQAAATILEPLLGKPLGESLGESKGEPIRKRRHSKNERNAQPDFLEEAKIE